MKNRPEKLTNMEKAAEWAYLTTLALPIVGNYKVPTSNWTDNRYHDGVDELLTDWACEITPDDTDLVPPVNLDNLWAFDPENERNDGVITKLLQEMRLSDEREDAGMASHYKRACRILEDWDFVTPMADELERDRERQEQATDLKRLTNIKNDDLRSLMADMYTELKAINSRLARLERKTAEIQ